MTRENSGQFYIGIAPSLGTVLTGPPPFYHPWQTAAKVGPGKPTPNYKEKAKDVFDDRQIRMRHHKAAPF